jgi:hypothetical protein
MTPVTDASVPTVAPDATQEMVLVAETPVSATEQVVPVAMVQLPRTWAVMAVPADPTVIPAGAANVAPLCVEHCVLVQAKYPLFPTPRYTVPPVGTFNSAKDEEDRRVKLEVVAEAALWPIQTPA